MSIIIHLPNSKYKSLLPKEDAHLAVKGAWAIADGVTRDPQLPKNFKSKDIRDILTYYPKPSGAEVVAKLFTTQFIKLITTGLTINKVFKKINHEIYLYNLKHISEVDYLTNDFFACVACGGFIKNNLLYYGLIGDCGLAIFNPQGKISFCTKDGMEAFINYENKYLKKKNFHWSMPEYRVLIRSQYRNRLQNYKGKNISYGALTGEKIALNFIESGYKKIEPGSKIVFFSDGFREFVISEDFSRYMKQTLSKKLKLEIIKSSLQEAKKDYEGYGRERSLIIDSL